MILARRNPTDQESRTMRRAVTDAGVGRLSLICLLKDVAADLLGKASRGPEADVSGVEVIEHPVTNTGAGLLRGE
jgi:hypothetical protein